MKRWIGMALALALSGCGTVGNIKYDFESGSFSDRTAAVMGACKARMAVPALDPIRDKVELLKDPPDGAVPFAIGTNTNTASEAEQRAIGLWALAVQACQADARKVLDGMPASPEETQGELQKVVSYFTDAWSQDADLRVQLYKGQISYADYAHRRLRLSADALTTALRYAQDADEENETHDLEDTETALEPYASLL